jgi:hypothetical protein
MLRSASCKTLIGLVQPEVPQVRSALNAIRSPSGDQAAPPVRCSPLRALVMVAALPSRYEPGVMET